MKSDLLKNFWYLVSAYSAVFVAIGAFVFTLFQKQDQLERELDALKKSKS